MKTDSQQNKITDNVNALTAPPPGGSALPQQPPENQKVIESLRKLQRADAFFNKLSPDQKDTLLDWLRQFEDIGTVHSRVAAPPPQGFGIQVSLMTLRRFRARWRALGSILTTEDILDEITDMELNTDLSQTVRIQKAINHMLHEKAFSLARTHPGSDTLKTVLTSIEKLSALDYKKQKLLLEREKLTRHFDLPKRHRVDLNIVPPVPVKRAKLNEPEKNLLPSIEQSETPAPFHQIADNTAIRNS